MLEGPELTVDGANEGEETSCHERPAPTEDNLEEPANYTTSILRGREGYIELIEGAGTNRDQQEPIGTNRNHNEARGTKMEPRGSGTAATKRNEWKPNITKGSKRNK